MRIFHPWVKRNLERKFVIFIILAVIVSGLVAWRHDKLQPPTSLTNGSSSTAASVSSGQSPSFNRQLHSVSDPASLWAIVNKGRLLPSSYEPSLVVPNVPNHYGAAADDSHLRPEAASALEQMFSAAKQANINLRLYSGYRSYANQVSTYNGFVKTDGVAKADTYSARPGHSEHQTGLAADVSALDGKCDVQQCFAATPEGQWLAANAYKYGFILRYQLAWQDLTGYEYEPWHFRFVGTDLAAEINKSPQTLEQFFGLATYKLNDAYPTQPYQLQSGN